MSKRSSRGDKSGAGGTSGFLSGLAEVLDKLGELAESDRSFSRGGEFTSPSGKEFKGVYGFNVKLGLGGEEAKVEPFGNIKVDRSAREGVVVEEQREPAVDVMEDRSP